MYASNTASIQNARKVIYENQDLFATTEWFDNCILWTHQLEKIINTKTYTQDELDQFLHRMALQKKSDKIYKLKKYIT